jgi:hypothetical protein
MINRYNILNQATMLNVWISVTGYKHVPNFLREAIPLCEQNRYRKIRRTQQKKVIYCITMQLVSTQLWGHHQANYIKLKMKVHEIACLTGL